MKKLIVVAAILLLVLTILLLWNNQSTTPKTLMSKPNNPFSSSDEKTQKVKYSIDYLKKKEFLPSQIEIEEEVRSTSGFTSYVVSYSSDNLKQFALMNVPSGEKDKFPVVIVNHGYINPEDYSTTQSYINTSAYFANNGFLVLKPDYRGHDNSETNESPNSRLAYVEDVLYLLASLENLEFADTNNVFMYGHSMGGDITLRIIETTDMVKAASLWAPVAQEFPESMLYFIRRNRTPERIKEIEEEIYGNYKEEDFELLTPLNYLDYIEAGVVVHHGTNDQSVPYSWSENLVTLLRKSDKSVEFYTYEGDNHDIANNFSRALSRDVGFFKDNIDN